MMRAGGHKISFRLLGWILIVICLLPWTFLQSYVRIPADAAWLFTAAKHILAGDQMTAAFYDSNPPLSYLIFTPAAIIAQLGVAPWNAIIAFTYGLIAFALSLSGYFLFRWPRLSGAVRFTVLMMWLASVTAFCPVEFGQKDHLIAVMIFPFLLAQLFLNEKFPAKRATIWTALTLGTPFILLKPHYGLLPVALIVYRFIKTRRLSIVFDPDFICLALGVIIYGAVTFLFFPDFISDALPASIDLYLNISDLKSGSVLVGTAGLLLFSALLSGIVYFSDADREIKKLFYFLISMAALAVIPFAVQNKGFSVHLIPALSLLVPSIALVLFMGLSRIRIPERIIAFAFIAIPFVASVIVLSSDKIVTHDDYRNSSFAKVVKNYAGEDGFFVEAATTDVVYTSVLYGPNAYASRFPSMWFMNGMLGKPETEYAEKFAEMMSEDFTNDKPKLLMLLPADYEPNLKTFAEAHPALKQELAHYKKAGEYELDYKEFQSFEWYGRKPPVQYDLYVRQD